MAVMAHYANYKVSTRAPTPKVLGEDIHYSVHYPTPPCIGALLPDHRHLPAVDARPDPEFMPLKARTYCS